MNNLITVFMNYRINRLITYGTIIYEDTKFIRTVLKGYFTTYIEMDTNSAETHLRELKEQLEVTGGLSDVL